MTKGGVTHVMPCHGMEWVWKFRLAKLALQVHTHTHACMQADTTASIFVSELTSGLYMPNIDLFTL